jgi:hypothetical protein
MSITVATYNKKILEETQAAFRYPAFIWIKTAEMRNNLTVGAAMNATHIDVSREVGRLDPVNATPAERSGGGSSQGQ